jgi:hypothetical protein
VKGAGDVGNEHESEGSEYVYEKEVGNCEDNEVETHDRTGEQGETGDTE